jgi:hypothetical protein
MKDTNPKNPNPNTEGGTKDPSSDDPHTYLLSSSGIVVLFPLLGTRRTQLSRVELARILETAIQMLDDDDEDDISSLDRPSFSIQGKPPAE